MRNPDLPGEISAKAGGLCRLYAANSGLRWKCGWVEEEGGVDGEWWMGGVDMDVDVGPSQYDRQPAAPGEY